MNQEMVKVTIDGKEHEYAIGTTYREIVDEYQEEVAEAPVILVMADGKLRELQKKLKGDCDTGICNDKRSYRIRNL